MNIRFLGAHNCESADCRLACLLIDGVLAIDAGGLTSALSFEAQQKLEAILLTHHHYDHIRDIPAVAMNLALRGANIDIYGSQTVRELLASHLLNGALYPEFLEMPEANPTVRFYNIEPYQPETVAGYNVLSIPVNHAEASVGYQITSPDGKNLFYTGDTGAGLSDCWENVSPQLLVIEATMSDSYTDLATRSKHLTPGLLGQELTSFQKLRGYLPPVIVVHMDPRLKREIEAETAAVAKKLCVAITLAREGMEVQV